MRKFIFIIIIFLFILFLWALYIDTTGVKVKEYKFESASLPLGFDGIKIIHFSDTLIKSEKEIKHLEQVVKKINNLNPDIIVFTGDLTFDKKKLNDKEREKIIKLLSSLEANLYKYAIAGDNDSEDVKEMFKESNFTFLDNEAVYLFNESIEPIVISGGNKITDEVYYLEENIPYNFAITLTHKPDNFDNINSPVSTNLVLAGHSLGGQVRVPFWGAVIRKNGAKKYTDDYYTKNNSALYVSYGIGTEKSPFRLFNKSSINVYRLYTK